MRKAPAPPWPRSTADGQGRDADGGTQLDIEVDTLDEFRDMFGESWPRALQKLKELAER
jgi:hypothetical protein